MSTAVFECRKDGVNDCVVSRSLHHRCRRRRRRCHFDYSCVITVVIKRLVKTLDDVIAVSTTVWRTSMTSQLLTGCSVSGTRVLLVLFNVFSTHHFLLVLMR